jgi:peroxiredoxin
MLLCVCGILLGGSVLLNGLCVRKIRSLYQELEQAKLGAGLEVGEAVPRFRVRDLAGKPVIIDYQKTGKPTVLYIFSPSCGWCRLNERSIQALANQTGQVYNFFGISTSRTGLAEYVRDHPMGFMVYTDVSDELIKTYKLGATPQTLVISPEGRVLRNWRGAYTGDKVASIEAFFSARIPALRP